MHVLICFKENYMFSKFVAQLPDVDKYLERIGADKKVELTKEYLGISLMLIGLLIMVGAILLEIIAESYSKPKKQEEPLVKLKKILYLMLKI